MDDKDVKKFLRAAGQRLTSAEILYGNSAFLDCMYVAGYSVECALKAMILARTPQNDRKACLQEQFRGAAAHDYEYLRSVLRQKNVDTSPISSAFRKVASWSTDLRYEVGQEDPRSSKEFLAAVKEIYDWVKRSL